MYFVNQDYLLMRDKSIFKITYTCPGSINNNNLNLLTYKSAKSRILFGFRHGLKRDTELGWCHQYHSHFVTWKCWSYDARGPIISFMCLAVVKVSFFKSRYKDGVCGPCYLYWESVRVRGKKGWGETGLGWGNCQVEIQFQQILKQCGQEIWNEWPFRMISHQASLVVQMVKNLPAMLESRFDPWIGKIPWRREWQPTPVFLPGESHGQRSLAGCSPWGHKESDTTEQVSTHSTGPRSWPSYPCLIQAPAARHPGQCVSFSRAGSQWPGNGIRPRGSRWLETLCPLHFVHSGRKLDPQRGSSCLLHFTCCVAQLYLNLYLKEHLVERATAPIPEVDFGSVCVGGS